MKVFIDTNIVLDFLDLQRSLHHEAVEIIEFLVSNDIEVCISEDMLSTIYYITKNKMQVLDFFTTISRLWKIVPFGQEVIQKAIEICKNDGAIDFEDALQCLCAKANECTVLITNDKAFFHCDITIATSSKFLAEKTIS